MLSGMRDFIGGLDETFADIAEAAILPDVAKNDLGTTLNRILLTG